MGFHNPTASYTKPFIRVLFVISLLRVDSSMMGDLKGFIPVVCFKYLNTIVQTPSEIEEMMIFGN
jgi:hypothetical protein